MKCIVLSAGYATRLYPLTIDKPKPLLEIAGKPMMDYIMSKIEEIDAVDEIFVVTNDKFFKNFEEWRAGFKSRKIKIINDMTTSNENRLGAIGDVNFVIEKEGVDDDILVLGGDNLFEDSLSDVYSFFIEKGTSVVAFNDVKDIEIAKKMGVGELDDDLEVVGFVEKPEHPKSTLVSALVYFIKKEDLHFIPGCLSLGSGEVKAGELISHMIKNTTVRGYVFKKRWIDIGSHEQLKEADEYWKLRKSPKDLKIGGNPCLD